MNILNLRLLPLVSLALLPLNAMASSVWQMWDNTSPTACNLSSGSGTTYSMGNSYNCAGTVASDPTMAVSAWSTTDSGQKFAEASVRRWNWTPSNDGVFNTPIQNAGATNGFDYGVVNVLGESSSDGQHSLDNKGNTDVLALNFTEAVALTSVSLGWISGDADISILRFVGPGTPPSIDGKTVSQLTEAGGGWELVGHYANLQNDTISPSRTADITGAGASSWWLISAFNQYYGNGTNEHGGTVFGSCSSGLTCGNDYVKLLQVAGNVVPHNETPEPGSALLIGAGLFGLMAIRRRRQYAL